MAASVPARASRDMWFTSIVCVVRRPTASTQGLASGLPGRSPPIPRTPDGSTPVLRRLGHPAWDRTFGRTPRAAGRPCRDGRQDGRARLLEQDVSAADQIGAGLGEPDRVLPTGVRRGLHAHEARVDRVVDLAADGAFGQPEPMRGYSCPPARMRVRECGMRVIGIRSGIGMAEW
jgi:hypothetical protein